MRPNSVLRLSLPNFPVLLLATLLTVLPASRLVFADASDKTSFDKWEAGLDNRFLKLTSLKQEDFVKQWAEDRHNGLRLLSQQQGLNQADKAELSAKIRYSWALGRLTYPFLHARSVKLRNFKPGKDYYSFLDTMEIEAPQWLHLEAYQNFLKFEFRHRRNNTPGINSLGFQDQKRLNEAWYIAEQYQNKKIRCYFKTRSLQKYLADFKADGLDTQVETLAQQCPGPAIEELRNRFNTYIAEREGHLIVNYKTLASGPLELHIYRNKNAGKPQAAVVWLHGGGWKTGSWSWGGGDQFFGDLGLARIKVEYRLNDRHGTGIKEAYVDTVDALQYIKANAKQWNIDASKIIVAGFSAGGHLSLLNAVQNPSLLAGAVALSGCTDLSLDTYSVNLAGGSKQAKALSPTYTIKSADTPLLIINAEGDRLCPAKAAQVFHQKYQQAGGKSTFVYLNKGGHFFLRDKDNREIVAEAIGQFLQQAL